MITLYTETPEETIKSLKSYFLIDDHVELVLNIDEIDSNVEKWCKNYCGELVEDKILFKLPFLFVSSSNDIINIINSNFHTTFLNEIRNINEDGKVFIDKGFLPLDVEFIQTYTSSFSCTNDEKILKLFSDLHYINTDNSPTNKLLNCLYDEDETIKYAQALILLMSNDKEYLTKKQYLTSLMEILKIIDYIIFEALK